jgi:hypothetical protein
MEPEGLHDRTTGPYPEPDELNPQPPPLFP